MEWLFTGAAVPVRLPGPAVQVGADGQGLWVLRAEDLLDDRQQHGELVTGCCRIARLSGPGGEVGAGDQRVRVLGAEDPFADGQQRGVLVRAVAGSPASPAQWAAWSRAVMVSG